MTDDFRVQDMSIDEIKAALEAMRPRATRIRLYYQEGELTNHRRVVDIGATNFKRPPPWALRIQRVQPSEGGHGNAEIAGVLEAYYRDGPTLIVEGRIDLGSEAGSELERLAYEGFLQTWSPDFSESLLDAEENVDDEDADINDPASVVTHYVSATFNGATVLAMPTLGEAVIELMDDAGNILKPALKREVDTAAAMRIAATGGFVNNMTYTVGDGTTEMFIPKTNGTVAGGIEIADLSISACAGPTAPSPSFFAKQSLPELQRFITITAEGHVYGHAAGFSECHIGYLDRCVTIREIADCRGEGNFEYATPGYVICSDGSRVPTGPLPIKGGHATKGISANQAMSHYDDPSSSFADVVYYMDDHGVQFTGAIRPDATESQIRMARASGVSLDARQIGGKLRYLATCAVNTPGFPKAHARIAASGEQVEVLELVAAGGRPLPATDDCGCGSSDITVHEIIDATATANAVNKAIVRLAIQSLEDDLPSA